MKNMHVKEKRLPEPQRAGNYFPVWLLLSVAPMIWTGCEEDDLSRKTNLTVVAESENGIEDLTGLKSSIYGGEDFLYVKSNVGYDSFFETSYKLDKWIRIINKGYNQEIKADQYLIECDPMPDGNYEKRKGTISFVSKDNYLGKFIPVQQGFNTEIAEDFSWLKSGTTDPLDFSSDVNIQNWTTAQVEKGWTSTKTEDTQEAFCYSKAGYIRLGDEGRAGDLITPQVSGFVSDSVILLTFKAVSYVSPDGEKDANDLTISILNGGTFEDGSTSKHLNLNYFDPSDPLLHKNMWKDNQYEFYIVSKPSNKLTGDTRIQFRTGEVTTNKNNRIFLDNIYAYIVEKEFYDELLSGNDKDENE
ncbi:MAG: hypothetical protein ACRCSQ_08820 [Bacteroidales bacterium]